MQQLLAPFHLAPGTKIVVAVSGGVDSMVLLTLLARLPGRPYPLTVAHFNHQLRAES
ncbi:ATP-binding protein, partial [Lacticaseibacillus nasuensis]